MIKVSPSVKRYWLAMNASAVDATVHSYMLISGVALVHVASDAVPAFNLQQCVSMFLLTFGRAILAYLSAHPVSQLLDGSNAQNPTPKVAAAPQTQEHAQS